MLQTPVHSLDLKTGTLIAGRYRVEEFLSSGPFAAVFLAADLELKGVRVCIKRFHPHLTTQDSVRSALRARVLEMRQLAHANILRTFDIECADSQLWYLVSEYSDGWSLAALLKERQNRPLHLDTGLFVLHAALQALSYAHKRSMVHGNLKPSNILISRSGDVKVCDFSLNNAFDTTDGFTATGEAIANPFYMAPEQFSRGQSDEKSDIYSWGVLAYQVLCGSPPERPSDYMQCAKAHVRGDLPTLFRQDGLPLWIHELLLRCCHTDPEKRPPDVDSILSTFAEHRAIASNSRSLRESLSPKRKRSKQLRFLLYSCLFLSLLAVCLTLAQPLARRGLAVTWLTIERTLGISLPPLRYLLKCPYDPNDPQALHRAVENADSAAIEMLLRAGANETALDAEGRPPMHALLYRSFDSFFAVVNDIRHPNEKDKNGKTLLHHAVVMSGRRALVPRLLKVGANPDIEDADGYTPLEYAVFTGDVELLRMILPRVQNLEHRDKEGRTALMLALGSFTSEEVLLEVVQVLLDVGIEVQAVDHLGRSTFEWASVSNSKPVIALLESVGMKKIIYREYSGPYFGDRE